MIPVVFFVLLFLTDGTSSEKLCSYRELLDHLNLTTDNSALKLTRPVLDYTHPTVVELDIMLYAILAVVRAASSSWCVIHLLLLSSDLCVCSQMEKTQTFIPFLWEKLIWNNELITWDPAQFCGITQISLPVDLLWKPDLFIYEMIQKDESPRNPYMFVSYNGRVTYEDDINVVSTCEMDVHKFPFDTQSCNISIGSAIHTVEEFRLLPFSNSSRATQFSREWMKTQGEWEFLHLTITSSNITYSNKQWEQLVYTFTIKRRPLLHVINFLLPILFFLSLDLASFFISDHRGEKLGFKVTVLLAISVLLLILNDILPSMSNKTPLIATYCIVIFALMLLSLLETILVTYLMETNSASQKKLTDDKEDKKKTGNCHSEEGEQTAVHHCSYFSETSEGQKQHEILPLAKDNRSLQPAESVLLLILGELRKLQETLNLHLNSRETEESSSRWAARINRGFFIFYVTTVSLFVPLIFIQWHN
uniref:Si:dkey-49c17.4 n=1 Tax=Echeneis naucrates TaxID=173247 RepID=A0A665VH88_ECHNA